MFEICYYYNFFVMAINYFMFFSDIEAGAVINSEEDLFMIGGPPMVDGAVVLREFAEACAAKATERARAVQAVEAEEFVGGEQVVWRVLPTGAGGRIARSTIPLFSPEWDLLLTDREPGEVDGWASRFGEG